MNTATIFSQEILIQRRHLHFPVRKGSTRVVVQIWLGAQMVREFAIELADGEPVDWWAFYDMSAFAGKTVTVRTLEPIPTPQARWLEGALHQSDGLERAEDLYHEALRPQFHFTSRRGWNNDPNGMVYHAGEWHLFFQHNPFGVNWGNMHWGHAVSRDLAHWMELPEALYQRSLADMAFSGGGVVDTSNSSGWKTSLEDPLVVAFTSTGRGECLAYSLDRGHNLIEYPGNPFLAHQGRDPKILWYKPGQHWVLIVYEEPLEAGVGAGSDGTVECFGYAIYTSTDLKHWKRQSFLPGWFECPELFELGVEEQPGAQKWVIYGSIKNLFPSAYMVGDFNGRVFTPEMEPAPAHFGPCFYASQVFSQAPDGRQIMMGWLRGASYPGMPFSQGMSVPLELSLRVGEEGQPPYRLCFWPVSELEGLRIGEIRRQGLSLEQANACLALPEAAGLLDLDLDIRAIGSVRLSIGEYPIEWEPSSGEIRFAGRIGKLAPGTRNLGLRVLVDTSLTEVFASGGRAAFAAMTIFPPAGRSIRLEGAVENAAVILHPLKSIWE